MITANGLIELGFKPQIDFTMRDNSDGNGPYIASWLSDSPQPTDAAIEAANIAHEAAYDSQAYARSRKAEYDKLNQDEMRYDDLVNGTTTWQDAIAAIKTSIPKG
jgi:hypothetical protein